MLCHKRNSLYEMALLMADYLFYTCPVAGMLLDPMPMAA